MSKKVLILLITILVIVLLVGGGFLAYFSIKWHEERNISRVDMSVTLEVSYSDMLTNLAVNSEDEFFANALEKAEEIYRSEGGDFIDIFMTTFNEEKNTLAIENINLCTYFGRHAGLANARDEEVVRFIRNEISDNVDLTLEILRCRLDNYGECKYKLQRLPGNCIQVDLIGVKESDCDLVVDLLRASGKLEFWKVYDDLVDNKSIQQRFYEADVLLAKEMKAKYETQWAAEELEDEDEEENDFSGEIMDRAVFVSDGLAIAYFNRADIASIDALLPELQKIMGDNNVVFYWGKEVKEMENTVPLIPLRRNNDRIGPVLSSETVGGACVVRTAKQKEYRDGRVVVLISMEEQAAGEWYKITREAMNNKSKVTNIAIVLDQIVYTCAFVRDEISNGNSEISGGFTTEEAKALAIILTSGAHVAKVNVVKFEQKKHVR